MNAAQSHSPKLSVVPEDTPNPFSNKFSLNRTLLSGPGRDFPNAAAALRSPLAAELFHIPDVKGVYLGEDFVTVSIKAGGNWWALRPLVVQTIENFIATGTPAVGAAAPEPAPPTKPLTTVELGIIQILETEIQPAVAMDGGQISFAGYENGIVRLFLRGACHSCPSSIMTLKVGIENRLKQQFPEIVAVEAM